MRIQPLRLHHHVRVRFLRGRRCTRASCHATLYASRQPSPADWRRAVDCHPVRVRPGSRGERPGVRPRRRNGQRGPRGPAEGRHERGDRVVGRWAGRHRLGGGDREARPRHRRLSERHRSCPRREVRFPQRPESPAGLELVPRQPGRIQRRAVRALQDDSRSRSEPPEPDAARHRADLEARGDRAGGIGNAPRPPGRSITSASDPIRPTTSTAWRARQTNGSRRCRSDSRSRTRASFEPLSAAETTVYDGRLLARRVFQNTSLLIAKLRTADKEENWERDRPGFGSPGAMDRVFFSCAACHVGRVMVAGKMKFLPGMPNTEIEAQYYSKLLMLTGAALVESGFDPASTSSGEPGRHQAQYERGPRLVHRDAGQGAAAAGNAVRLVAGADRARKDSDAGGRRRVPERHAGSHRRRREDALHLSRRREEQRLQAAAPRRPRGPSWPDGRVRHRLGSRRDPHAPSGQQLSGIRAPRQSEQPVLLGILEGERPAGRRAGHDRAGHRSRRSPADRIFKNIPAWAPPVPAPIDIKSVNWATERYHANWDGNQGASSRTLASGASATGDPRMVNVRIHEPLNPFIDNLPPPPYPFASVDLARAREGKALFKTNCATCHTPRNQTIYPASKLGVDPNRTMVNTSVSRYGLAALVMEACSIYGLNNQGQPGADWCVPQGRLAGAARRVLPRHAAARGGGHQRLQGGHAARHLGAGAVPAQRIGSDAGPAGVPGHAAAAVPARKPVLRRSPGRLRMGGPARRRDTARNDTILIKEYDTTVPGKANTGHTFGADLCPDTSGLDPDRRSERDRERASCNRRSARCSRT